MCSADVKSSRNGKRITNSTNKTVFSQQCYTSDNMRQIICLFPWHCGHQQQKAYRWLHIKTQDLRFWWQPQRLWD